MFSIQTLHSRRMLHVAGLLLWSFLSIILIVTWLRSLPENNRNTTLHVAIWLGVLTIYFFAEGLEMAYVDLRDKDAEQLTRSIRGILDLMNSEPGFLEAREWLLVVLVAVLTLISDFSHIDVPMVGYLEGEFWKVAFPLAFAAFPLVWFSQSLPKHLALRNAEAFLELSQNLPIWRLIRRIGIIAKWIGLFLPSDLLVDCACRKGLFSTKRNLPPSESAFFVSSLKRYGYALYRLYENVEIQADGRCRFQQKGVMYLQQGRRLRFTQFLRFESKIEQFEFPAVRLYAAPLIGEKLDEMAAQMNMVWKNKLLESFKLKEVSTKTFRKRFESDRIDYYKLWYHIVLTCELTEELRLIPSSLS